MTPSPAQGPGLSGRLLGWAPPVLERALALNALNGKHARLATVRDERDFTRRALGSPGVRFRLNTQDLELIPRQGPLLVVAEHPFGGLDGLILLSLLRGVRPGVPPAGPGRVAAWLTEASAGRPPGTARASITPASWKMA